ncbi:MAG: hypothetical protein JXB23_12805 [Candidatus Aminicenantes bacterium]|nr:hypothetical protein [Candidatus Aminicenantes bacterium]
MMFILFTIFLLMLLIPFLPGIQELIRPKDPFALPINLNYSRDPRFFGKSFRAILQKSLDYSKTLNEGIQSIRLSKEEIIEIRGKMTVPEDTRIDHILYITGNLISREDCVFDKEIYVRGRATIGENCKVRALAAEGRISLGRQTKVIRWVDSEDNILVDKRCDLGWNISCEGKLQIGSECLFRRLFGMPIVTWDKNESNHISPKNRVAFDITQTALITDSEWTVIPPAARIDKAIISKQNLLIKCGSVVHGDIKSHRKLLLEDRVRIVGNVFAEGDVTVGAACRILGNVFSQGAVKIGRMARIGKAGKVKSLVCRKELSLDSNVVIYGYVISGKRGEVL